MSQENVDAVRAGFEAFSSGDFERLLAWLDPAIEWDVSRRQLEPAIFHGHEEVREFLRSLGALWSDQRFELQETIDAGDSVMVTIRFVSRGRAGIEIAALAWYVWELRAGLLLRSTMYQTRADALEAVGLRE